MKRMIRINSITKKTFLNHVLALALNLVLVLLISSCGKNYSSEHKKYITKIEKQRFDKDNEMRNDPTSPFNYKGKIKFNNLKYFDVDPDFVFRSKLFEFSPKDTVTIFGTKGEPRQVVRYGYVLFNYNYKQYKINVYEGKTRDDQIYYSIWFTDKTTNDESYGVGRYIDFEKQPDPNYIYEVDFNLAYNPYCAYSSNYSCAIPTKEDYIPLAITAGEKKFHD